jgi:hypothetical protein
MVYFQTKNLDLGKFCRVLAIEDIGIFCGRLCQFYGHLVYFMVIWYIFLVLVYCTKKNLANPAAEAHVTSSLDRSPLGLINCSNEPK